jgi:GNAT superfamily N-acetyltransferase
MEYRFATSNDLDRLAEWNHQLIRDEGHRNAMSVAELRERMKEWLEGEYRAVIFGPESAPVAYALFRESNTEVYVRQLFVRRDMRSQGIGGKALELLRQQVWPQKKRLTAEVLTSNVRAVRFWRSVGYKDYCLTLEIAPDKGREPEGSCCGSQAGRT